MCVLLVYWTWRYDLQVRGAVHMEKWDLPNLGDTLCSQLLGAHVLSGCDTVSYPFGKGNARFWRHWRQTIFRAVRRAGWGVCHSRGPHGSWTAVLCGTVWTTHGHLDDSSSVQALHPQTGEATEHNVTASNGHKYLPPCATCSPADVALWGSWSSASSRWLHLRVWLENRRWEKNCPSIVSCPPGPPLLMNVISCRCRAKHKACKECNCSCYREKLSCTIYFLCTAGDECRNPFRKKGEMEENDDQHDHEYNYDYVDRDEL